MRPLAAPAVDAMTRRLRLPDGRRLGYLDCGDPQGKPVLFFHGLPGSRWQSQLNAAIAASLNIRLIAVERPGFGLSDFQPGRTLRDWPNDVTALVDSLSIDRFAVVGVSGGGPYAAVCAWRLFPRLTRAILVSSMAPGRRSDMDRLQRWLLGLARWGEPVMHLPVALMAASIRRDPDRYFNLMAARLPPVDRAICSRPAVRTMLKEDMRAAFEQGPRGARRDAVLLTRPWGFELSDIRAPTRLWHGGQDAITPLRMGRELAAAIPRCQPRFIDAGGHFLIIDYWREILQQTWD